MLPQDTSALSPETSNSFEVGLKSRFFNDMLRFNIAAFLDKFKNYQVNFFDTFNGSPVTRLINAGRVSPRGVEIDEIGRASCRERVLQSVEFSVVPVQLTKKHQS